MSPPFHSSSLQAAVEAAAEEARRQEALQEWEKQQYALRSQLSLLRADKVGPVSIHWGLILPPGCPCATSFASSAGTLAVIPALAPAVLL